MSEVSYENRRTSSGQYADPRRMPEVPRHTLVESECGAKSELQSFEGVSVDRLQQMFRKSKERMAKINQDDVDGYLPQSSVWVSDSRRVVADSQKACGRVSISRANSGSTTASSSKYNQAFDDGASDTGSDGLPLGAEWYSFNQH